MLHCGVSWVSDVQSIHADTTKRNVSTLWYTIATPKRVSNVDKN